MADPRSPFHFYLAVWGEAYINKFFKYALPTLLSDRNLPSITTKRVCTFNIVTAQNDVSSLQDSNQIQELSNYLKVNIFPSDIDNIGGDKYVKMTVAHNFLCRLHASTNCYAVFLSPDTLISNGALSYFDQTILAGKQAIVLISPRIIEEEVSTYNFSNLEPRELVKLIFKHIHPEPKMFMMNSHEIYYDPSYFIWPGETAWIIHALYALPVVVSMSKANPDSLGRAVEVGDFVPTAVPDRSLIDVVCDSDLAVFAGVAPQGDSPPNQRMSTLAQNVRDRVFQSNINDLQRWYFTKPLLIHSDDLPPNINDLVKTTSNFVDEVLHA